jgi:hypothetical protein
VNIRLSQAAAGSVAGTVVEQGGGFGRSTAMTGRRVNVEFVSANPTGPIHIGGVRWAAVGDALSRLLRAEGADVTTEYYLQRRRQPRSTTLPDRCRRSVATVHRAHHPSLRQLTQTRNGEQ